MRATKRVCSNSCRIARRGRCIVDARMNTKTGINASSNPHRARPSSHGPARMVARWGGVAAESRGGTLQSNRLDWTPRPAPRRGWRLSEPTWPSPWPAPSGAPPCSARCPRGPFGSCRFPAAPPTEPASCGRLGHGVWGKREADIDTPNSASLGRGPWREHESIGQPDPVLRQGLALFWPVLSPTGWTGAPARSRVVGTRAVRVAPEGSLNAGRVAPWPSVVRRCPGLVAAAVVPLTNVRMVRRRLIIAQPATAAIRRSPRVQPLLEGPRQQGSSRLDAPCLPRAIVTRDLPP